MMLALILLAAFGWFVIGPLGFVPLPWPSNLATSPALHALFLGLSESGLTRFSSATLVYRIVSFGGVLLFAWALWRWAAVWISREPTRKSLKYAAIVFIAALLDPVIRWSSFVLRPDAWAALAWIWVLRELYREETKFWRLGAAFALTVAFHPILFFFLPIVLAALYPFHAERSLPQEKLKAWASRSAAFLWRSAVALLPVALWLYFHPVIFSGVLAGGESFGTTSEIFNGIVPEAGSPVPLAEEPLGSFLLAAERWIFWTLAFLLTNRTSYFLLFRAFNALGKASPKSGSRLSVLAAAGGAFWLTLFLWLALGQPLMAGLAHLLLWPWLAAVLENERSFRKGSPRLSKSLVSLTAAFGATALLIALVQQVKLPYGYTWENYSLWIRCIERTVHLGFPAADPENPKPLKIRQTELPDAWLELKEIHPEYLPGYSKLSDVIIHSRSLSGARSRETYEGPERARDRELLDSTESESSLFPSIQGRQRTRRICQVGPFWANISLRQHSVSRSEP